jgi:hypothetical protein
MLIRKEAERAIIHIEGFDAGSTAMENVTDANPAIGNGEPGRMKFARAGALRIVRHGCGSVQAELAPELTPASDMLMAHLPRALDPAG